MKKLLTLTLLASSIAFAQEGAIKMPFNFENSKVLPKGIRNVMLLNAQMDIKDKYNGQGAVVGVANAMNKSITWKDIIDGKRITDPTYANNLEGALISAGISPLSDAGQVTGTASIAADAKVPVMAYGLSKRMTVAVAVPYVKATYDLQTGSIAAGSMNNFTQNLLLNTGNSVHKAYRLQSDFLQAVTKKLVDLGYNDPRAKSGVAENHLGDIKIVGKYQLTNKNKFSSALKLEVTAPTGETADVNDAIAIGYGDGQWDLGIGLAADYVLNSSWSFSGFAGYTFQFADYFDKRIPTEETSMASKDIENIYINLGDQVKLQTSAKFSFFNGWSVSNGATFQYKFADEARGELYAQERYDWLTQYSAQSMTALTTGIGFSTIPLFRQGRFKAPINIDLFYTNVVAGQNVATSKFYTVQFAMFF